SVVGTRRGNRNHALEPFELPENESAVRPGTVVGDVEVVAARLRLEAGRAVSGDEVAELAFRTHEAARDLGRAPLGPFSVDEHAHPLRLNPPWRPRSSRPSSSVRRPLSRASPSRPPKHR